MFVGDFLSLFLADHLDDHLFPQDKRGNPHHSSQMVFYTYAG
jgi:hypothetical protein